MERVQKVHSITNAQTAAQPKTQEEHLFKGKFYFLVQQQKLSIQQWP